MKVLVLEDNDAKFETVSNLVKAVCVEGSHIDRADCFASATKAIYETRYDTIVADLMIPDRVGQAVRDITTDFLALLEASKKNSGANVIALTAFEEIANNQRQRFSESAIALIRYDETDNKWESSLRYALARIHDDVTFDFLIVCALDVERNGYRNASASFGEFRNIRGLDCVTLTLGRFRGVCVKLPRMGLVEACVVTAQAIEKFRPKIVCMSGICAGVREQAPIGTLVVADPCWEYQAGKWADTNFKIEHYDVGIKNNIRTQLSQLITQDPVGNQFKHGIYMDKDVMARSMIIAPMATGSAVIASSERMDVIREQHRKMAALDMEMYGVYKAAELAALNPIFFGIKTVVDTADEKKGDTYHEFGSVLSARATLGVLDIIMNKIIGDS